MTYEHVEYAQMFTATMGRAKYGKRRLRSGRVIWVNYGHELKNGKGLTLVDHLTENIVGTQNAMLANLSGELYVQKESNSEKGYGQSRPDGA